MRPVYEILIVEDEYTERRELAGLMEEVTDCEAAIQMISQRCPDLILLDIMLKGRSGFEVAQFVRSRGLDCRIMILTAYNEFDFASKAMSMGIQDYLLKPMRPDPLLQRIRGVLDRPAAGPARTPQLWPCLACGMTHGLPEPLPMLPAQVMVALLSAPLTPEEEEQLSRQGGQALQGGGRLECHERQVVCYCRPEEGESPEDAAARSGAIFPQQVLCRYTPCLGESEPYPVHLESRLIRALRSGEDTVPLASQLCSQLLKSCQGDAAILERWLDLYCGALSRVCGEAGQDWMPHLSLDACFTPPGPGPEHGGAGRPCL